MLCKTKPFVVLCERSSVSCTWLWFRSSLGLGRRKSALGGLVSAAWEKWGMLVSDSSIQISGWVKCIQSICVEHCGKSAGEMTVGFPSSSYR